jgi:predicted metal-binding protein
VKIGIIRCQEHSSSCAGYNCFPALYGRKARFARYENEDKVELVGFDTCGGCARGNEAKKIVERALRLKNLGAEAIHIGWCLYLYCPFKDVFVNALREQIGIPIIEGTHALHTPPPGTVIEKHELNPPPADAFDDSSSHH